MGSSRARLRGAGRRPRSVFLAIGLVATMSTPSTRASDRMEAIERSEASQVTVIVPGIELRPLAGGHNGARGLFTGLLSLAPGAIYPFYGRPVTESLVVLEGEAALDVEDRRYHLGPRNAAAVLPMQPRRLVNRSADRPVRLHVALASENAEQSWINGRFVAAEQPPGATGRGVPSGSAVTPRCRPSSWHPTRCSRTSTTPSSARKGSAAATDSSNPAPAPLPSPRVR